MINNSVRCLTHHSFFWLTFGVLFFAGAVQSSQTKDDELSNESCLDCHDEIALSDLTSSTLDKGGMLRLSVHSDADCIDCHSSITELPHVDALPSVDCGSCHDEQADEYTRHGADSVGVSQDIPTCSACHGSHAISPVSSASLSTEGGSKRSAMQDSSFASKLELSPYYSLTVASCGGCHPTEFQAYSVGSIHGRLIKEGDTDAPTCVDCHGAHDIPSHTERNSPTYPTNIPTLCGNCHRDGNPAAIRYTGIEDSILQNYTMSIHGKGLYEAGLTVTATCVDCHSAHQELPASDTASTVNNINLPRTCAKCHDGIFEKYKQSVHYSQLMNHDSKAPSCADCHHAHTICRVDNKGFKSTIIEQCGGCHERVVDSYFETFHGKVSKLGFNKAAACYNCHNAHYILPPDDPRSTLAKANIVATCKKCHAKANSRFAAYLTHADHNDRKKHPALFYSYWLMTILLFGTLVVAGTHTLLWLPQSLRELRKRRAHKRVSNFSLEYQRFTPQQRFLHVLIVISFLGLALTGMTLRFSNLSWAQWLSSLMGGFATTSYLHRIFALITFFYFAAHLYFLAREKNAQRLTWKKMLFGRESMLPNKQDAIDAFATIKWFIGLGPQPDYGRWTYWEKFDYFAVFWGVLIIGSSGLVLWFPEYVTLVLPGWVINVANIVHSDEALLAVAFIFTIHFFNTHLRPGKFPMDTVIFTGRMSIDELKEERHREYKELMKSGRLKKYLVQPLPRYMIRVSRVFAACALFLGIGLIVLIIYAELFGR